MAVQDGLECRLDLEGQALPALRQVGDARVGLLVELDAFAVDAAREVQGEDTRVEAQQGCCCGDGELVEGDD